MRLLKRSVGFAVLWAFAAVVGSVASAGDMPKRKAGLWEVGSTMEGMPMRGAVQICVDANSDNLMQQRAGEKANCSVMEVKAQGAKMTLHSVCKTEKTTVTTDAVFTGSFESAYKGDVVMRYAPPMDGIAQMKVTMDARWLGSCKTGQKPGDVVQQSMDPASMQNMMNDPNIRDMMKQKR